MRQLFYEQGRDIPLAWFSVTFPGGAIRDPGGREGLSRHAAELSRRGAAGRSRQELDDLVDGLGASLGIAAGRDSITLSAMCLSRHLDRMVDLAGDVLAAPNMAADEHDRLVRENLHELDDLRDDDASLGVRFFNRFAAPGYCYARTALGTVGSLNRLTVEDSRTTLAGIVSARAALVGFAGDLDEARARRLADRLAERVPDHPVATQDDIEPPPRPAGRRLIIVDKPSRTQSQIWLGHIGPRYGTPDATALLPVETAFGGMFSSRLMQEIRVARGWSYGAGSHLLRARGPHYFRMHLAPSAEVTPDALALTLSLYEQLIADGLAADELAFARDYLSRGLPFSRATARQRLRASLQHALFDLPPEFPLSLPARLDKLTLADTHEAIQRWLSADDLCIVVVATAESMRPRLEPLGFDSIEVVPFDSY